MLGNKIRAMRGVTLLELLLVVVIASAMFVVVVQYSSRQAEEARINRTTSQIQQILDAATAYYVANGTWPGFNCVDYSVNGASGSTVSTLVPNYLPATLPSPYATSYIFKHCLTATDVPKNAFRVYTNISTIANFKEIIMGVNNKLAFTSAAELATGGIIAYTSPPPLSINRGNIEAFNFAGLYHQGACVPTPTCPTIMVAGAATIMDAQLILVPISVSGVNDDGSTNVYPISSFTAYASGSASTLPTQPTACVGSAINPSCTAVTGTTSQKFWRACIQIITERGDVQVTRTDNWGNNVTMAAFTRCSISGEASGSPITVFGN